MSGYFSLSFILFTGSHMVWLVIESNPEPWFPHYSAIFAAYRSILIFMHQYYYKIFKSKGTFKNVILWISIDKLIQKSNDPSYKNGKKEEDSTFFMLTQPWRNLAKKIRHKMDAKQHWKRRMHFPGPSKKFLVKRTWLNCLLFISET